MLKANRIFLAIILFSAIWVLREFLSGDKGIAQQAPVSVQLPIEGELPTLMGATSWLNGQPLTKSDLRGKVVVIQFWTYTCINWLRTLPYVNAWSEKYKDKGLIVIGVHTPEFSFERNIDNVRRAAKEMGIDYPIAIDSDNTIWRAFNNNYWPALYFADSEGRIRHHHFGEGDYDRSEKVIQQLLVDAGAVGVTQELVVVNSGGASAAADLRNLGSPENYVGYERTENFASPEGPVRNKNQSYGLPWDLTLNHWGLSGDWTMGDEALVLNRADGHIAYRFHSRDLNVVMGPSTEGKIVRFRVLLNGDAPGESHGIDTNREGYGTISELRLYQLIRQPQPIVDRQFDIEFFDTGIVAFAFTFG